MAKLFTLYLCVARASVLRGCCVLRDRAWPRARNGNVVVMRGETLFIVPGRTLRRI